MPGVKPLKTTKSRTLTLIQQQQIFGNPLIMNKILDNVVKPQDILNFRLVNIGWRDLCTTYLLRKFDLTVNISYRNGDYYYGSNLRQGLPQPPDRLDVFHRNINHLTNRLPSNSFSFHGGHLDHPQVQRFFNRHGKDIRHLELKNFRVVRKVEVEVKVAPREQEEDKEEENQGFYQEYFVIVKKRYDPRSHLGQTLIFTFDPTLFIDLTCNQVPYLRALYMDLDQLMTLLDHSKTAYPITSPHLMLPNLKVVELYNSGGLQDQGHGYGHGVDIVVLRTRSRKLVNYEECFKNLIQKVAVNLEVIDCVNWGLNTRILVYIQSLGRLDLIPNFQLGPSSGDKNLLGHLETLASCSQWRLKKLDLVSLVPDHESNLVVLMNERAVRSLGKILDTCHQSLQEIKIQVMYLEKLLLLQKISRGFPNVTKLELSLMNSGDLQRMCYDLEERAGQLPTVLPSCSYPLDLTFPSLRELCVNDELWWIRQDNDNHNNRGNRNQVLVSIRLFETLRAYWRHFTPSWIRIRKIDGTIMEWLPVMTETREQPKVSRELTERQRCQRALYRSVVTLCFMSMLAVVTLIILLMQW